MTNNTHTFEVTYDVIDDSRAKVYVNSDFVGYIRSRKGRINEADLDQEIIFRSSHDASGRKPRNQTKLVIWDRAWDHVNQTAIGNNKLKTVRQIVEDNSVSVFIPIVISAYLRH